tara:strand:- start:481 stop:840 length:360 start_codon:yes stop_codon:yes gene_type:complete
MKKAKKKEKIEIVADLVDCYLVSEITEDELVKKLMWVVDKPMIKISEMEYIVTKWKGTEDVYDKYQLECRSTDVHGQKSNWVQVEDLTELRVWEYNKLVGKLKKHYPDYAIVYLEGRFV